jgi:molybdopterin-guanine dinucleotide biosynthesis protein A
MLPRRRAEAQDGGMPPATGIVLAGGASRRMGSDKRLLDVDGEPMLRRVARVVADASDELIVSVSGERPLPPGVLGEVAARVVVDRRPGAGPLAGLEAALQEAAHPIVIVVAADMPDIDALLLRILVDRLVQSEADAVAVATDRGPQPLLAAYRREPALAAATRLLDSGERRMRALLEALDVRTLPDDGSATNANTPADLVAMEP